MDPSRGARGLRGARPPPTAAAEVTLAVDAGAVVRPWNRFYEKAVASDHAHTLLCTAYGRNIQNALRKAHAQAGFQYVRFHGIFNDDVGVYTEDASGAPIYDWSRVDAIYDAIVAAGMRPLVEISFTPTALASDARTRSRTCSGTTTSLANISPPTGADRRLEQVDRADGRVRSPPRGSVRRRRGPHELVLRGVERAVLDVLARATAATSSCTGTPSPGLLQGDPGGARGRPRRVVGRVAVVSSDR